MNYAKIYNTIIEKRRNNIPSGYTEIHHITPRSLGGTDEPYNLVKLTAKEHFICHLLLTKMYPSNSAASNKMIHAFLLMCKITNTNRHITSLQYTKLKIKNADFLRKTRKGIPSGYMWICNHILKESKMIKVTDIIPNGWVKGDLRGKGVKRSSITIQKIKDSKKLKDVSGANNGNYGKKWYHNIETEVSKKFDEKYPIPEGWIKGKVSNWDDFKSNLCNCCGKPILKIFKKRKPIKYCSSECRYNRENRIGFKWYNNSIIEVQVLKDGIIPDGYIEGRL